MGSRNRHASKKRATSSTSPSASNSKQSGVSSAKHRRTHSQQSPSPPQIFGRKGPPRRCYSDLQIEERVFKLYLHAIVEDIPMVQIRSDYLPGRTHSESNVKQISEDIRESGFRKSEAIAVWKQGDMYSCIHGNQRYLSMDQASGSRIPCFVIDDMPNPTREDLEFAALLAKSYTPRPSPESFASMVTEVRTVVSWLQSRGMELGTIRAKHVLDLLPKRLSKNRKGPVKIHWSHGDSSVDKVNKVLGVAKVFIVGEMETVMDDIERKCYRPAEQVPRNVLLDVKKFEQLKAGAGKGVLQRYLSELTSAAGSSSASASTDNNKKRKLWFTKSEQFEFKRLKSLEQESLESTRANVSVQRNAASSNEKGIRKLEKSIALAKESLTLFQNGNHNRRDLSRLADTIGTLESILESVKE